ncbi:hypothetical protein GCM10023189_09000 [Nibrella saemangeumensis]|uniref:Dienelactone hydrolase domain-containing protein n=1 Tax=Nibrella saemangeumensis TaxID=1084526 RepID=A0ABP8MHL6_9BACT
MKVVFVSLLSLIMSVFSQVSPQKTETAEIPLCQTSGNDMSMLAANKEFQMMHPEPVLFTYESKAGSMITFPTPDGKTANGFFLKSKNPSDKWLLVYQEWWGLNDHIKQEAEKMYNDLKDVNVLAVDMYDGQVASKREDAAKLMQGAQQDRLQNIMKGAIAHAGPKARIGSIGWCFGGMLSLQSAILAGKQADACVMYYGRPVQDVEQLKKLDTDVLGVFGSKDRGIPVEMVNTFQENMKKAGEKVTIKMYNADHAFANPSNTAGYDKEAATDAYKLTLNYLKERLKA